MYSHLHLLRSYHDFLHDVVKSVVWIPIEDDFPHRIFLPSDDDHACCAFAFSPYGVVQEFLIMLATIEKITGEDLSFDFVDALFRSFVQWNGCFALHIDEDFFKQLLSALRLDSFFTYYFAGQFGDSAWSSLMRLMQRPVASLQDALLPHLIDHVYLGCRNLQLFRRDSFVYGLRPVLIQAFLHSFYRALWSGVNVFWHVLPARHAEQAVVNIYGADVSFRPFSLPFLPIYSHGMHIFVNYPQLGSLSVLRLYYFLTGYFKTPFFLQRDMFTDIFQHLSQRYIGAAYRHFARGLPVYDLYISRGGGYTLAFRGFV